MGENVNSFNEEEFEKFLDKYHIRECYKKSGLDWRTLQQIFLDYQMNINLVERCCKSLEEYCQTNFSSIRNSYHSIRCRPKDPEHLIEKIIRKRGKEQSAKYNGIDANSYKNIIQDLIGLRILVIKKEDWEPIFDKLVNIFPSNDGSDCYMAEKPIAYIRYGDCDIYNNKIKIEYSNKGYRSLHYIVRYEGFFCEIQVRTLAEEVFGEFDHLVKYPYRNDNNFLIRYTNTLSKLTNAIDEIISTCFQMNEDGWKANAVYFKEDYYEDWSKRSQNSAKEASYEKDESAEETSSQSPTMVRQRVNDILLRKEGHLNGKSSGEQ